MSQVAGRLCEFFRAAALSAGLPPERFFARVPFGPDTVPAWVEWRDFIAMIRELRVGFPRDEDIVRAGSTIVAMDAYLPFARVVRLAISPRTLYWASDHWSGPMVLPGIGHAFADVDLGRIRITLTIKPEDEDCPEFFLLVGGMFRVLPRMIRLPDAVVDVQIAPRTGTFTVLLPPSTSVGQRVKRALNVLFSRGADANDPTLATFNQLAHQQELVTTALRQTTQALEVRQRFLASVSHELRTPLHGILGLNDLLLGTGLDRQQRELAESLGGCARSLLGIINGILDFSRLEAGGVTVDPVEFELRRVVDDAIEPVVERARAKGLELVAVVPPSVPHRLQGQAAHLRQVLGNLVDNAVKFTAHGQVVVHVSARQRDDGRAELRFEVDDTGIGVQPDRLDAIFHPFTQGDASTSRRYGGTGLGLAICRQLTELMEGEIGCRPLATGSRFWFTAAVDVVRQEAEPDPALAGRLAAVLEPDAEVRAALCAQLQALALDVVAAGSSAEVRAALGGRRADLLVVDETLRDEVGACEPSAAVRRPPPPVLWLARMREGRLAGLPDVLLRPVRHAALADGVRAALRRQDAREAGHAGDDGPLFPALRGRVLVAEDNPVNQQVAVGMLARLACEVRVVADGRAAVEAVAAGGIDLVLMDCQMPELDGYEATRAIRRLDGLAARVPVVAMTAHAHAADRTRCLDAGMDEYLAKPVGLAELATVLDRFVPQTTLRPRPPSGAQPAPTGAPLVLRHEQLAELEQSTSRAFVRDLVRMFFEQVPRLRRELATAAAAHDGAAVRRTAHRLKGSCRYLGLDALTEMCRALDEASLAADPAGLTALLDPLDAALAEADAALREALALPAVAIA